MFLTRTTQKLAYQALIQQNIEQNHQVTEIKYYKSRQEKQQTDDTVKPGLANRGDFYPDY